MGKGHKCSEPALEVRFMALARKAGKSLGGVEWGHKQQGRNAPKANHRQQSCTAAQLAGLGIWGIAFPKRSKGLGALIPCHRLLWAPGSTTLAPLHVVRSHALCHFLCPTSRCSAAPSRRSGSFCTVHSVAKFGGPNDFSAQECTWRQCYIKNLNFCFFRVESSDILFPSTVHWDWKSSFDLRNNFVRVNERYDHIG